MLPARRTGTARHAADCLLGERDATGQPREGIDVLRGDPNGVAAVADTLAFEHKNTVRPARVTCRFMRLPTNVVGRELAGRWRRCRTARVRSRTTSDDVGL